MENNLKKNTYKEICIYITECMCTASLLALMANNLPTMWETQVRSLGWDDPLEAGMATHSSILAWKIPWTEEPGGVGHN